MRLTVITEAGSNADFALNVIFTEPYAFSKPRIVLKEVTAQQIGHLTHAVALVQIRSGASNRIASGLVCLKELFVRQQSEQPVRAGW